jgi:hypothetical protein
MAKNQKDVEVLRVPQGMMNHRPQQRIEEAAPPPRTRETTELVPVNNALAKLEESRLKPGDVLSEAHLCPDAELGGGSRKSALFLSTADKDIRLGSAEGGANATVGTHLISLPESFNTENTAISLRVPASSDEFLSVMLNRRAADSYSLSEGREGQCPTIVKRKVTSLMQVIEYNEGMEVTVHRASAEC